jgi:hypothetical protein
LCLFLDRLSVWDDGNFTVIDAQSPSNMVRFCRDFLIQDLFLGKIAYPGTVADKEYFSVAILECLLTYSMQDGVYSDDNIFPQNGVMFNRKRSAKENETSAEIIVALLSKEVIWNLFALLHSIWDSTRKASYKILMKLLVACQIKQLEIPYAFSSKEEQDFLLSRAFHLTSSPRQREADTGSRMLAFIHASFPGTPEREKFLTLITDLLGQRIESMKCTLKNLLSGNVLGSRGSVLPLAHGLVHASRLCLEQQLTVRKLHLSTEGSVDEMLYGRMVDLFCQGLQISLSVVADVREGESIDGVDEEETKGFDVDEDSTPLNVNTGAIGANGTFSSVSETDENERAVRLATQRVVVRKKFVLFLCIPFFSQSSASSLIQSDWKLAAHEGIMRSSFITLDPPDKFGNARTSFSRWSAIVEYTGILETCRRSFCRT